MAMTNSERQAAYRDRIKEEGGQSRLNVVVHAETDKKLEELAKKYGVSKAYALTLAMAIVDRDEIEARTRSKATGKTYRTAFEKLLAEASSK